MFVYSLLISEKTTAGYFLKMTRDQTGTIEALHGSCWYVVMLISTVMPPLVLIQVLIQCRASVNIPVWLLYTAELTTDQKYL